jgi:hypothetical protein
VCHTRAVTSIARNRPFWAAFLLVLIGMGAILVYSQMRLAGPASAGSAAADRWTQIESKWSPQRERARADLAAGSLDFAAQLQDYKAFYDATKGWVDDVRAYDWANDDPTGEIASNVRTFLDDSDRYLALLEKASMASTPDEIVAMSDTLPAADQTWDMDVAVVRLALGLPVIAPPTS